MNLVDSIYRPLESEEKRIRSSFQDYIFSHFSQGVYNDSETINSILKKSFQFYEDLLKSTLDSNSRCLKKSCIIISLKK